MRRRGFSLPELLVSASVALVVLGVLAALVIWGMRIYSVQSVENQRFQLGSMLIQRLRTDLRASCVEGVSLGPDTVALVRLKDLSPSGEPIWDDRLVVYRLASGVVRRGEVPATFERPRRLTVEELAALELSSAVPVMDQVSSFTARLEGRTLSVDLATEYPIPGRLEPGRQTFQTSLALQEAP